MMVSVAAGNSDQLLASYKIADTTSSETGYSIPRSSVSSTAESNALIRPAVVEQRKRVTLPKTLS